MRPETPLKPQKAMALFRKLATRIVWTLDARSFRQRGVYLFSMPLFNIAGRGSQLFTKRSQIRMRRLSGTDIWMSIGVGLGPLIGIQKVIPKHNLDYSLPQQCG
jgi:hypothetical protein